MLSTWDFALILFLLIGTGYGLIFKRGQIVVLFVSSYIGFVVVNELGGKVFKVLNNVAGVSRYGDWAEPGLKVGLFAVIMVLLAIWAEYLAASAGKKGLVNLILAGIYGFALAAMILSIISIFLPLKLEVKILALSRLAPYIINYRMWWFFIPAILMLVSGIVMSRKGKK